MRYISNTDKKKSGVMLIVTLLIIALFILTFSSIAPGAQAILYGDVNENGDVDVNDVLLLMRYILSYEDLTESQKEAADINKDGKYNVIDASLIMRFIIGLVGVDFEVTDDQDPAVDLEDAEIKVFSDFARTNQLGSTLATDADGEATLDVLLADGTYYYTITCAGYATERGSFTVTGADATVNVVMQAIDTGSITGTVTDQDTAAGIEGAIVKTEEIDDATYSATTDSDGEYTIENVPLGTHEVTASHPDYAAETKTAPEIENDGDEVTLDFALVPDQSEATVTPADLTITAGDALDLSVTDAKKADGSDLDGASVAVTVVSDIDGVLALEDDNVDFSAVPGEATIEISAVELTTAGTHKLTVTIAGVRAEHVNVTDDVEVEAGAPDSVSLTADPVTIDVGQETTVTATVTDDFGNTLEDITVEFSGGAGSWSATSVDTDADGEAEAIYTGHADDVNGNITLTATEQVNNNTDTVEITVTDDEYVWPEEMEGEPDIVFVEFANQWSVTITIKDEFKDDITSVTIKDEPANQDPNNPERWRAMFAEEVSLADLVNKIDIAGVNNPDGVEVIDLTKTSVIYVDLIDNEISVRVYLKAGETAIEVTADNDSLTYNSVEDRWQGILFGYEPGDEVTVIVTTTDGIQTKVLTVKEVL